MNAPSKTPSAALVVWQRPALSPALRSELERIQGGPIRLPALFGEAGEVLVGAMVLHHSPEYREGAAEAAAVLRAELAQVATIDRIRDWLCTLMLMLASPPSREEFDAQLPAFVLLCRQLPAAVFSDEALIAYCDDPKLSVHWPVPKEVRQFLSAYAAKLGLDIQGFDAMARAPRAHTPARAAPYTPLSPYVDSPPVTEEQRAHLAKLKRELAATLHRKHKQVARDDAEARRSAEAQLALLLQGDRDAAARALAENNARRYPWLYPKPAESAPIAAPPLPSAEVL